VDLPTRAALLQAHPPEPALERERRQRAVEEIVTLHGLEVQRRKVAYGNINPRDATAIFIRSALVEENLMASRTREEGDDADRDEVRVLTPVAAAKPDLPPSYRFLTHNRRIREKIENWRTRVRHHALADLDVALAEFYARHLTAVSSLHELKPAFARPSDAATPLHFRSRTGWRKIIGL